MTQHTRSLDSLATMNKEEAAQQISQMVEFIKQEVFTRVFFSSLPFFSLSGAPALLTWFFFSSCHSNTTLSHPSRFLFRHSPSVYNLIASFSSF